MPAKFDWYECSLDGLPLVRGFDREATARQFGRKLLQTMADFQDFADELDANGWRLDSMEWSDEHGFNHYRYALVCYTPQRVAVFRLLWSELTSIHLIASGKRSPIVCKAVRKLCPVHFVTRADSALDFDGAEAWATLVEVAERLRNGQVGRRMSATRVLQDVETGGKTYYLGSMKSSSFLRVYDKTQEQRAKVPKHLRASIPDEWTRAEVVARPADKERRLYLAHCTPLDVWSVSQTYQDFYELVEGGVPGAMPKVPPRVEDFNKAYWTMLQQYKRTFAWLLRTRCGGDIRLLGEQIGDDLLSAGLL